MSYIYDLTDTWNAAGTVFTSIKMNVTDSASATGSKLIDLQIGGVSLFNVDKNGGVGIGTSSPASILHASSAAVSSDVISENTNSGISASNKYGFAIREIGNEKASFRYYRDGTGNTELKAAGPLLFNTDSAERMRIDGSGNVGIGTSSPQFKLHVSGGSAKVGGNIFTGGINTGIFFTDYSVEDPYLYGVGRDPSGLRLYTNGTVKATLDASGNLGLGVTPSAWGAAWKAEQFGAAGSISAHVSVGAVRLSSNEYANGSGNIYLINANATRYEQSEGQHKWFTAPSGTAGNAITFTQAMTLDASGRLALNTTDPTLGSGQAVIQHSANNGLVINSTSGASTLYLRNGSDSTPSKIMFMGGNGLTFADQNGNERMRIDSSGSLLVGTTSNTFSSRSVMRGSGVANVLELIQDTGSTYSIIFTNSSGTAGSVTTSGATTQFNTSSDARLKHDIVDAPEASSLIDAIKVRSFKWNADNSEQRYGMVAQELLEVAPEAVSVPADEDEMMGVDYSKLVPMLIKEVQQLRARVAQLEGN